MTSELNEAAVVKNLRDLVPFTLGLSMPRNAERAGGGALAHRRYALLFRGLSSSPGTIVLHGAPGSGDGAPDATSPRKC